MIGFIFIQKKEINRKEKVVCIFQSYNAEIRKCLFSIKTRFW